MSNLAVIACVYEYERGIALEEVLCDFSHFSDVVYSQDKCPVKGIAFHLFNGEDVSYVTAFKKSGKVATKVTRLSFTKPIHLEHPLSLKDIQNSIPKKLQGHFNAQTSIGISTFSPKVYQSLMAYIQNENPSLVVKINQLKNEILGMPTNYRGHSAEIIAHEKDAISLALRISNFTDYDMPAWSQENDTAPFLRGYDSVVLREDPIGDPSILMTFAKHESTKNKR